MADAISVVIIIALLTLIRTLVWCGSWFREDIEDKRRRRKSSTSEGTF